MYFDDIRNNILNNVYKIDYNKRPVRTSNMRTGYITDENKSVKWNKEQVDLANNQYMEKLKEFNIYKLEIQEKFTNDVIDAIKNESKLSESIAYLIYNKVSDDYDSQEHLLNLIEEYVDFVLDVIDKYKNNN